MSQVKAGLKRAAVWLLVGGWFGLVCGGIGVAFTPSPHSPAVGWGLLAIAAIILIATMDRWVGIFSALLAYGIIGGILTIVEGHAVNNPQVRVPRFDGIIMTLLISASAVVSFTFTKRKLRLSDRIALFTFIFCFFWGAAVPRFGLLALAIGLSSLALAWGVDHIQRRRDVTRLKQIRHEVSTDMG